MNLQNNAREHHPWLCKSHSASRNLFGLVRNLFLLDFELTDFFFNALVYSVLIKSTVHGREGVAAVSQSN